jgi:hypothetical protein
MTTPGIRATYFVADHRVVQEVAVMLSWFVCDGQAIELYSTQRIANHDE